MRIVTPKRFRDDAKRHPAASPTLDHWTDLLLRSQFANLLELRRLLPTADQATVRSGRTVTIFTIKSHIRLVTAIP